MRKNIPKAPEARKEALETKKQLLKMTPDEAHQAMYMAQDRLGRLSKRIKEMLKVKPGAQLKETHKRLIELNKKFNDVMIKHHEVDKRQAKLFGKVIIEINKVIETKMPQIRTKLLTESLQKATISRGGENFERGLIGTFSLLKYAEEVKFGNVSYKRQGNELIIKKGKAEFVYTFKIDAGKWKVIDENNNDIRMRNNPLVGLGGESRERYKAVTVEEATPIRSKEPAPKKAPKAAEVPEKAKETPKEKIAEVFKFLLNPPEYNATVPAEYMRILKDFIKDIPNDGDKKLQYKNLQVIVTRSNDGKAYRFSSRLRGKAKTRTVQYYVEGHKIGDMPKGYEKTKFKDDPIYASIEGIMKGKATKTTEKLRKVEAKQIKKAKVDPLWKKLDGKTPNPIELKAAEEWVAKVRDGILTVLRKLDYTQGLAKRFLRAAVGENIKRPDRAKYIRQAQRKLNRFKNRMSELGETIRKSATHNPDKIHKKVERYIAELVPKQLQHEVRTDFPSAPQEYIAKPKAAPSKPAVPEAKETSKIKAYDDFLKFSKFTKNDIYNWLPPEKGSLELAAVFRFHPLPFKSPVRKDKAGNEFYINFNKPDAEHTLGTYDVFIKKPGEKVFKKQWIVSGEGVEFAQAEVIERGTEKKETKKGLNPLIKEKAKKYIDKVIDKKTVVLKDVTKGVKIHDVLKTPTDKAVFIRITRKNGEVTDGMYFPGDETYTDLKSKRRGTNRCLIYDGDKVEISSTHKQKKERKERAIVKLNPREKEDLKEHAKEIGMIYKKYKTMDIETYKQQDKKIVLEDLRYISKMHKRANEEKEYRINSTATLKVFKNGSIYGSDIGRKTFQYWPETNKTEVV